MRYLSSISLVLIVLMALACKAEPAPTPTPYAPLYTTGEVIGFVKQWMDSTPAKQGTDCVYIRHRMRNWRVDVKSVDYKEKYYVTANDNMERPWSWTFFGNTGKVLPTSTHQLGKVTGC